MATTPHPTSPPPKPNNAAADPQTRKPEPLPTAESAKTVADEQRERSEEIQRMGVAAYMAQFDTRSDEEKGQKPVAGVAHRPIDAAVEAQRR